GNLTNLAGGLDASNRTVNVGGDWTWAGGTLTATGSIAIFSGGLAQALTSGGQSLNQGLPPRGRPMPLGPCPAVGGSFTNSAGTFDANGQTVTVARNFSESGGDVTAPSSTLSVGGAFIITGGSFDANGGTVILNGTGTQSFNSGRQAFADLVHSG